MPHISNFYYCSYMIEIIHHKQQDEFTFSILMLYHIDSVSSSSIVEVFNYIIVCDI